MIANHYQPYKTDDGDCDVGKDTVKRVRPLCIAAAYKREQMPVLKMQELERMILDDIAYDSVEHVPLKMIRWSKLYYSNYSWIITMKKKIQQTIIDG